MRLDAKNDESIRDFENWVKDELYGTRKEVTKEQPMSDTLMEEDDQMSDFQPNHSCSDPACPCQEWFTQPMPVIEHEPAARGGGDEWRVAQRYDGVVLIVRQESDNRETPLLTLGKSDDDYVMADKIVTEHNQHQSLMAEREVLREALRGVRLMLQTELKQYQSEPWAQRVNEAYEKDGPR